MADPIQRDHPLAGCDAKLRRAEQNLKLLDGEIGAPSLSPSVALAAANRAGDQLYAKVRSWPDTQGDVMAERPVKYTGVQLEGLIGQTRVALRSMRERSAHDTRSNET